MKGCLIKRNLIENLKYSEDFKENNQMKCNVTLRIFAQLLANDLNYIYKTEQFWYFSISLLSVTLFYNMVTN